jgi:gamma-glutamyltranspeptidase/glutathione hydrolase
MPVLVRRSGTLVGAHGTMGGRAQPQIHTQIALHLAAGSAPQEAVSRPRWVLGPMEAGGGDASSLDVIKVEQDVPRQAHEGLEGFGFALSVLPPGDDGAGHAQLVRSAAAGLVAATDPRADGAAFTG